VGEGGDKGGDKEGEGEGEGGDKEGEGEGKGAIQGEGAVGTADDPSTSSIVEGDGQGVGTVGTADDPSLDRPTPSPTANATMTRNTTKAPKGLHTTVTHKGDRTQATHPIQAYEHTHSAREDLTSTAPATMMRTVAMESCWTPGWDQGH
jgi:hypothetical protein